MYQTPKDLSAVSIKYRRTGPIGAAPAGHRRVRGERLYFVIIQ